MPQKVQTFSFIVGNIIPKRVKATKKNRHVLVGLGFRFRPKSSSDCILETLANCFTRLRGLQHGLGFTCGPKPYKIVGSDPLIRGSNP